MGKDDDCGFLIKQINDKLETSANRELRDSGLTLSQLRFLEYICDRYPKKVLYKELEAVFEVAQPTVAGIIRRLADKGHVISEQSAEDSRAKTVSMTEWGYRKFMEANDRKAGMERMILEPLDDKEKKEFQSLLKRVYEHLR